MTPGTGPKISYRLKSIDFLRGLIMVIMALDHVRDFITGIPFDPLDLSNTDNAFFATRWITHFCAPLFVLLAGVSVGLMAERKNKKEIAKFLLSRGLWLIFIEVTVVSFAWYFTFEGFGPFLQVIFVIGLSMLILAALIWLPGVAILIISILIITGHNLLDYGIFPAETFSKPVPFWHMLHVRGFTRDLGLPSLMMYPILPWIAVMPLGYLLAKLYTKEAAARQRSLLYIGLGAIALFILLRAINIYGDPQPWSVQNTTVFTIWSFINTQKYPPSLLFLLMTLGPGLIVLSFAERWKGRFFEWMVIFGRVPFFYYVIHLYLIHLLTLAAAELQGLGWHAGAVPIWRFPATYGYDLWVSWVVWVAVVAALYPACRWFANIKATRNNWWLKYL